MDAVIDPGRPPLFVLVHTYPLYSTTFIANEVEELRRQGVPLVMIGIRRPRPEEYPEGMEGMVRSTTYLLPLGWADVLRRHTAVLARRPRRYLQALGAALCWGRLSSRDRLRTLLHFGEAVCLVPVLESGGCGHLHAHALSGAGSVAMFLNILCGLKYSLTAHGTDIFVENVLLKHKMARAEFTRVATAFNRDHLARACPAREESIRVLPFGVDTVRMAPGPHAADRGGAPRLLNVGRLVWQKAHPVLLRACALLRQRGVDFRLVIVGEGEDRARLEGLRRELGLADVVDFPGALPEERVREEYRRADLFVLSSISEGFGMVLLEAMACEVAVVAPAVHGLPEIVTDGVDGRLFTPGSSEVLAAVLEELARDPEARRRLAIAGRLKVLRSFSMPEQVGRFRALLAAAVSGSGVP